ncbi:Profilin-4 [Boothiomyces sp. JEL0866]|nr:Profilin-4 [Boothiomyces sp. JEL0866]
MNALLQEALIGTKHISHAAIIKKKDGSIKAKSPFFIISPQEIQRIETAFLNPGEIRGSDGVVTFMDNFYKPLKADSMSIYAKNDQSGIIISQTLHHYIIGTYDSTMYASVAAEAVEKLGEYFRKKEK